MSEDIWLDRLNSFRGAPFPPEAVESAVDSIREQCGWHIAPVREDTVDVYTVGRREFMLETLLALEVSEVRDADNPNAEPFTGRLRVQRNGRVVALSGRLPEYARVTFTHGHEAFPGGLLPVVADRANAWSAGRIRSESLASRSISVDAGVDPLTEPMIARFRVGRRSS